MPQAMACHGAFPAILQRSSPSPRITHAPGNGMPWCLPSNSAATFPQSPANSCPRQWHAMVPSQQFCSDLRASPSPRITHDNYCADSSRQTFLHHVTESPFIGLEFMLGQKPVCACDCLVEWLCELYEVKPSQIARGSLLGNNCSLKHDLVTKQCTSAAFFLFHMGCMGDACNQLSEVYGLYMAGQLHWHCIETIHLRKPCTSNSVFKVK